MHRQDLLHHPTLDLIEDDLVLVKMTLWSNNYEDNKLWAEYYLGVMGGVMALTGIQGDIKMDEGEQDGKKYWTYLVTW